MNQIHTRYVTSAIIIFILHSVDQTQAVLIEKIIKIAIIIINLLSLSYPVLPEIVKFLFYLIG